MWSWANALQLGVGIAYPMPALMRASAYLFVMLDYPMPALMRASAYLFFMLDYPMPALMRARVRARVTSQGQGGPCVSPTCNPNPNRPLTQAVEPTPVT